MPLNVWEKCFQLAYKSAFYGFFYVFIRRKVATFQTTFQLQKKIPIRGSQVSCSTNYNLPSKKTPSETTSRLLFTIFLRTLIIEDDTTTTLKLKNKNFSKNFYGELFWPWMPRFLSFHWLPSCPWIIEM